VAAWLLVSGAVEWAAANSAASRALMARRRIGAPITYMTSPMGARPYITNVMIAPNTVPLEWVASATAIIRATYNQAMGTMYMGRRFFERLKKCQFFEGRRLRYFRVNRLTFPIYK
jgi:carbamoylphosphate synthase large subunit